MHLTTQSSNQLQTVFGGEFVHEHHRDETHWNLAQADASQVISSLTITMLGEAMKSLRSALSLH